MKTRIKINGVAATKDDWGRLVFDLICKRQRAIAHFGKNEVNIITEV
jgi:hypothetical protein